MTFEELNRTMEFIVQHQAELSVKLDRDHEWAKGVIGQLAASDKRIAELIESSARRLEQNDKEHRKFERAQVRSEEFQREVLEFQREALARLDRILQRLTDRNQKSKLKSEPPRMTPITRINPLNLRNLRLISKRISTSRTARES
jgi:hypothetical protein